MTKPQVKLVEGFGKGLLADIKGKTPFLKSDITDGFSIKVRTCIKSARVGSPVEDVSLVELHLFISVLESLARTNSTKESSVQQVSLTP